MTDDSQRPVRDGSPERPASPSAPNIRGFDGTDWSSFGLTTLVSLAAYLVTLAPEVTLELSGIFSVGAAYGGVPHPPGYPLWTVCAGWFTELVPISNIAWRAAAFSASAGALTCGLIALMVSRVGAAIAEAAGGREKLTPRKEKSLRILSGYAAGMVFGFNGAFWGSAVVADVWTLSLMLMCVVLCLLLHWSCCPERRRYLYLALFVFGLTLTNSQLLLAAAPAIPVLAWVGDRHVARDMALGGSLVFILGLVGVALGCFPTLRDPTTGTTALFTVYLLVGLSTVALAVALSITTRRILTEWKATLVCCGVFLLGLTPYLYVPLGSMTNPPMNWGYPRTVTGFIHVLSRGQYERIHATNSVGLLLDQVRVYVAVAGQEFGWPFLVAALIPLVLLRRMAARARRWLLGLSALYGCLAFLVLAVLNPTPDRQSIECVKACFGASYVVLALWMGCGLILLGIPFGRVSPPKRRAPKPEA